ncbi:MAG: XdhC family protein [Dethiobacter sp.]|jgi:xanthine dehydrogenase accessory factor|nr:XdhC family protein [Dethiobacter sp.]
MNQEIYTLLSQMVENREPAALVTVVEAKGSSPGRPGFRMLVDSQGNTWGTVGGGLLEATVIKEAVAAISEEKSRIKTYTLTQDKAKGLGMVCGGEITVFIDAIVPSDTLVIAGAGHVAQPLAAMAAMIQLRIVVIDDREEFCNPERFPTAGHCLVGDIQEELKKLKLDKSSYIVLITRGHALDQAALETVVNSEAAYIGMIGSKTKVKEVFSKLREKGVPQESLQKVYTPIGLEIGAQTAEEIAVSILAEIIAVKNKKIFK